MNSNPISESEDKFISAMIHEKWSDATKINLKGLRGKILGKKVKWEKMKGTLEEKNTIRINLLRQSILSRIPDPVRKELDAKEKLEKYQIVGFILHVLGAEVPGNTKVSGRGLGVLGSQLSSAFGIVKADEETIEKCFAIVQAVVNVFKAIHFNEQTLVNPQNLSQYQQCEKQLGEAINVVKQMSKPEDAKLLPGIGEFLKVAEATQKDVHRKIERIEHPPDERIEHPLNIGGVDDLTSIVLEYTSSTEAVKAAPVGIQKKYYKQLEKELRKPEHFSIISNVNCQSTALDSETFCIETIRNLRKLCKQLNEADQKMSEKEIKEHEAEDSIDLDLDFLPLLSQIQRTLDVSLCYLFEPDYVFTQLNLQGGITAANIQQISQSIHEIRVKTKDNITERAKLLRNLLNQKDFADILTRVNSFSPKNGGRFFRLIPPEINYFPNLKNLELHSNELINVSNLKGLKELKHLGLTYNKLNVFPIEVCSLRNLQTLNIASNNISEIPDEIGNLTNLEVLSLSKNKLRTLPKGFSNLHSLKSLDVEGSPNLLLPETLCEISKLKVIYLDSSTYSYLPMRFGREFYAEDSIFDETTVTLRRRIKTDQIEKFIKEISG